jgi:hypothetical protein
MDEHYISSYKEKEKKKVGKSINMGGEIYMDPVSRV